MKKEQLTVLGLDDATAQKVADASAEELKTYVPKTQYDEAIEAKKALDGQVKERDKQLDTLKKSTGDATALQAEIAKLQDVNKDTKTVYEAQIKQMKIDNAVESALTVSKAKNNKAVRALLNLEKAELDDSGIKGLSVQIKKLQESEDTKFLFDTETTKQNDGTFKGATPPDGQPPATPPESAGAQFALKYNSQFVTTQK